MTIPSSNSNIPKRSQASIGLGIVTHISESLPESKSKNNAFFDISTITYPIKPPPPLLTVKTCNQDFIVNEQQVPYPSLPTFTDRIRCIVLANRKSSVVAPEKKDEKAIIPFPIPIQRLLTPSDGSAIPIISLSPNFSPSKTNIIPSLSEVPMLGDMDDNFEYKFFMSPTVEDDLIGKHIWKFRIIQLLGEGAFSKVYLADDLEQGGKFAIKMIQKERIKEDKRIKSTIEREVGVLKFLDHDRIVQLEATMETEQYLCIVLEYVQGEELFDFVQRMHTDIHKEASKTSIDEQLIKRLALELVQVVSWLHNHNIVHRDLKLENILVYYDNQGELHLKITDFGLARVFDPKYPILSTRCGSEEYAAPEIVQSIGYDGRLTDTWSIGIILYALLVGYLPFSYNASRGERISHLFHRIVLARVNWPCTDNISVEAKEVVQRILVRQPDKRIRLHELDTLSWFQQ